MATSKRKKATPSHVEDIAHEVVPQASAPPAVTQPEEAVVVAAEEDPEKTLEITIAREIKRFNLADAGIEELKAKYGDLQIIDVNDRAGYETVKRAWNDVLSRRTGLEKKGLEIRGGYNRITKAVKGEEDRLIGLLKPLEDDLKKKWKKIDDDKEAEKQRLAQEAEAKLQARVQELLDAGCEFKLGYYGIGQTIAIDVATLREMPEEQFAGLKEAVVAKKVELDAEAARLAEQKRLEDEQREADKKKLKELEDQQKADKQAKRELRLDLLDAVGMSISAGGREVAYDNGFAGHRIPIEQVDNATDAEFKELVRDARAKVAEAKEKMEAHEAQVAKEREELEKKKVLVNDLMIEAGFSYNYGSQSFGFTNKFLSLKKEMGELVQLPEADLKVYAETWAKDIAAAREQQTEHDQQAAAAKERERVAQLSDEQRFTEYLQAIGEIPDPVMQSDHFKLRIQEFNGRLTALIEEFTPAEEAVSHG